MSIIETINNCRLCKSTNLEEAINLGEQIITSRFPVYGDFSTPKTPISLCLCNECGLLQLYQTTFSSELYEYEYGYRSGISNTMREHLKNYQEEILTIVKLNDGDTLVDIGSNDSTMLHYYSDKYNRIGVDPTGDQFKECYGDVELLPTYFTYDNFQKRYPNTKCKLVSSISMFYDLPDPVQFAKDIYQILEDDGIWTCEQSYMPNMIKTNSIDTICHEHLEYYGLIQIKKIADMSDFKIIDIKFNDCNGGSFRVYFAKNSSLRYNEKSDLINSIVKEEQTMGYMNIDTYKNFIKKCDNEVNKLKYFINETNKMNKKTYVYGASTKGNCLLQYANLGETEMKYAVERNPKKVGKMTNTGIEIIDEEKMRESPPDFLLVLPWHFRKEIIERENTFLKNGGQLVFPFPIFEIVSYKPKPKVLITGCNGFLAGYVIDELKEEYTIYGINRSSEKNRPECITFNFDMNDYALLEKTICTINPKYIIHLSAVTSSIEAFNDPIQSINTNGLITAKICDIIHKNKLSDIVLFNSSSSEIYKGNVNHVVDETSYRDMFHIHPYSISKILSHQIVQFYRDTYGYNFSNGIIFTCQSSKKSNKFLFNKLAEHIKENKEQQQQQCKENNIPVPLEINSISAYRNIIHPFDVATAIKTIITNKPGGQDYNICNMRSYKMYDLVIDMYKKSGITLKENEKENINENILYNIDTGLPVIKINKDINNGLDQTENNIQGLPTKLLSLGWTPTYTVNDILDEILIM
jgi:GDP-D-mannose dehydratase